MTRLAVLNRDGWRCGRCGAVGRLQVHHLQALEHGGAPFDLDNLASRCRDCHIREHGGEPTRPDPGYAALVDELLHGFGR